MAPTNAPSAQKFWIVRRNHTRHHTSPKARASGPYFLRMTDRPSWLATAIKLVGTREAAGPADNPTIIAWARQTPSLGMDYNHDSIAWCGLFAAYCVSQAGLTPPPVAVRAKAWATWGIPAPSLVPGAVLVFERPGGGRVGFYVGEDSDYFHVLGGNQGDAVSIVKIDKTRCIAKRWPAGVPVIQSPPIASLGLSVSKNEA